jgi:septal ring factor EnvC (AmiA/AmiB activator)
MRRRVFFAAVSLAALVACNAEKRRLTERLAALEQQHAIVSQRLAQRRGAIDETERRISTLNADLTAHNTEVHAFIGNHKLAAACIKASRTSWGSENAFGDEVSATSRISAALCGVALLNGEFAREVAYVADKLRAADARVKELKEQMAAAQRTIDTERAELRGDQDAADVLAAEMAGIRGQISAE